MASARRLPSRQLTIYRPMICTDDPDLLEMSPIEVTIGIDTIGEVWAADKDGFSVWLTDSEFYRALDVLDLDLEQ